MDEAGAAKDDGNEMSAANSPRLLQFSSGSPWLKMILKTTDILFPTR